MKQVLLKIVSRFQKASLVGCLIVTVLISFGCATPQKSNFLTGNEPMQRGKYVNSYWSVDKIDKQIFSKIYVEPIDISRIQNYPEI